MTTTVTRKCPECGCEINAWMNGAHTADCPIGRAEDSLRMHDMSILALHKKNWWDRVIWPHEVRLQEALGNDVGPACRGHNPEKAAIVRVFAHAIPMIGLTDEQVADMPAQWVREVIPYTP